MKVNFVYIMIKREQFTNFLMQKLGLGNILILHLHALKIY